MSLEALLKGRMRQEELRAVYRFRWPAFRRSAERPYAPRGIAGDFFLADLHLLIVTIVSNFS
jgi:hypothetical protein